jgi:hypothetical protein
MAVIKFLRNQREIGQKHLEIILLSKIPPTPRVFNFFLFQKINKLEDFLKKEGEKNTSLNLF